MQRELKVGDRVMIMAIRKEDAWYKHPMHKKLLRQTGVITTYVNPRPNLPGYVGCWIKMDKINNDVSYCFYAVKLKLEE